MWYFAWILGVGLACSFGILNAMWYELHSDAERDRRAMPPDDRRGLSPMESAQRGDAAAGGGGSM